MKERPILFSGPMVRALLDGSKTQTRRALKVQPMDILAMQGEYAGREWIALTERTPKPKGTVLRCRFGVPGDRLWVREAWRTIKDSDDLPPRDLFPADRIWYEVDGLDQPGYGKYRPPMFMPFWARRITLEITGVRVERLQDIGAEDALSEGIKITFDSKTKDPLLRLTGKCPPVHYVKGNGIVIAEFASLWEQINGHGSWDANPWVWVVEFKVVKP